MPILHDKYNDSDASFLGSEQIRTVTVAAQTFEASSNYPISSVKIKISRFGSPNNVTVEIQATTGSAGVEEPSGVVLATITVSGNGISTGPSYVEFTFASPYTLTTGVVYAIVVKVPAPTGSGKIIWDVDDDAPVTYLEGSVFTSQTSGDAGTWTRRGTKDAAFETWGAKNHIESAHPTTR